MKSVMTIMWANITHKKGAFKGIIALMTILTMSFAISLSNADNTHRSIKEGIERAGIGNFMVSIMTDKATDEMYEALDKSEDITSYRTEKRIIFRGPNEVNGISKDVPGILCKNDNCLRFFDENDNITDDKITINKGEIYLTYKMKNDEDFKVGNTLKMRTKNGYDEVFTIKGFYEDPLFGSVLFGINNALISDEDFDRIYAEKLEPYSEALPYVYSVDYIFANTKEGVVFNELRNSLNDECGLSDQANFIHDDEVLELYHSLVADTGTKVVYIFVLLLLIIVMITIKDSIASSIEMDYTSLGILKANGFTKGKIRMIFILQYVLAIIIGTVIGLLLSIPLTGLLGRQFMKITSIFTENKLSLGKCCCVSMGILLVCILFVAAATHKIGRISPVRAISGGKDDVYFDSRLNVRIRRKPLGFFIALRQITSRFTAYIGSTFIVALLVFFMASIMVLTKGLDAQTIFNPINYDVSAYIGQEYEDKDMQIIKNEIYTFDKHAKVNFGAGMNVDINDIQYYCHVNDGDIQMYLPLDGRAPIYDNEIFITELISREIGKGIGDTITVNGKGSSSEFIITGLFQTVYEDGRIVQMTIDGAKRIGNEMPRYLQTVLSDSSRSGELVDYLNERFEGKLQAELAEKNSSLENAMDTVDLLLVLISNAMYVICVIFAAVVVHMVCAKTFQRERTDIGVYKAIGMRSSQLRTQFALRFAIVAFIGSCIGCAAALLISKIMLSALMSMIGLTNFLTDFSPSMLLLPTAAMVLSFFAFAYIASSRVNNVETRELITE